MPTVSQKSKVKSQKSGFTLIELLITIALVGILSAIIAYNFGNGQKLARDTQRKSDLNQYKASLESFANANNNSYPTYTDSNGKSLSAITLPGLTGIGPEDPKNASDSTYTYLYQSNDSGTAYILWDKLESATNTYWVLCSSGQSGKIVSSSALAPNPAGVCPGLTQ